MSATNPALRKEVISIYKGVPTAADLPYTSLALPQTLDSNISIDVKRLSAAYLTNNWLLELLNLGKEYPQGFDYFRPRLHRAFMANAHLRDEDEIRKGIARAEFVRKGARPRTNQAELWLGNSILIYSCTEIEAL